MLTTDQYQRSRRKLQINGRLTIKNFTIALLKLSWNITAYRGAINGHY